MLFTDILRADADPHVIPWENLTSLIEEEIPAMRTITRPIALSSLDKNVRLKLDKLFKSFGREKSLFINKFKSRELRALTVQPNGYRLVRDRLVAAGRVSPYNLQARHWKMALQSAHILVGNYWKLVKRETIEEINLRKWPRKLSEIGRRYLSRLLYGYESFFAVLDGRIPRFDDIELSFRSRKGICLGVVRAIHQVQGRYPQPSEQNTVWFDCSSYDLQEKDGRQYISLMSLEPRKRIRLELLGHVRLHGKPTVMLVKKGDTVVVHASIPLKTKLKAELNIPKSPEGSCRCIAMDAGVTEVATLDNNVRIGEELGKYLLAKAEEINTKLKGRNRLQALAKTTTDPKKRRNILKFNLQDKTWSRKRQKLKTRITQIVNEAFNKLRKTHPADVYVVEELSQNFTFSKKISRRVKRMLSSWVRSTMRERLLFKAAQYGIKVAFVAAAYSSQACPRCGYADRKNREGDKFECLCCGHKAPSDQVGAQNILLRVSRGGWKRRMRREDAWQKQRETHIECCSKLGISTKADPHIATLRQN